MIVHCSVEGSVPYAPGAGSPAGVDWESMYAFPRLLAITEGVRL